MEAADSVAARVAAAAASKAHPTVRTSIGVWDARTGEPLYASEADTPRRPASVLKIATTAAALLALGPDRELATEVFATCRPDDRGQLAGDLVVRGGGDPGISNRERPGAAEATLREMARAVAAARIRRVGGDLVLDDSAFSGPPRHPAWNWQDGEWQWWKAPVAALLLTDACVDLTVFPGERAGAAAVLRLDPDTQAVRFVNRLVTVSDRKRHSIAYGRTDPEGRIPVVGSVWTGSTGFKDAVACVDPAAHFGDVFLRVLREEGVEVAGRPFVVRGSPAAGQAAPVRAADLGECVPVARHATKVLDVVRIANTRSQNLYAEILLRAVGRAAGDGSFEGGCRAVRAALGLDAADASLRQVDGSGLARENSWTASAIGRVLVRMYGSPHARGFIASLPRGGDPEGTLRDRFQEPRYANRVYAKTGTLRDTSSLAGYVRADSGRTFAFAILCEGDPSRSRALQDAVVAALVGL